MKVYKYMICFPNSNDCILARALFTWRIPITRLAIRQTELMSVSFLGYVKHEVTTRFKTYMY